MEGMEIIGKLRKIITQRYQDIVDCHDWWWALTIWRKYKYMLGQIRTYQYIIQEISSLLKQKEQK